MSESLSIVRHLAVHVTKVRNRSLAVLQVVMQVTKAGAETNEARVYEQGSKRGGGGGGERDEGGYLPSTPSSP